MLDVFAIVQGITELLPISSTLHLNLAAGWLNIPWGLSQEISLHLGTLIAFGLYFMPRQKWPSFQMCIYLLIATLPAIFVGFYIKKLGYRPPSTWMVYGTISGGLGLILAEAIAKKQNTQDINISSAILIGCAQVLAFIPGASRMGTTVTMARMLGVPVQKAIEFSWLLAIPTVGGAIALTSYDAWKGSGAFPIDYYQTGLTAIIGLFMMHLVKALGNTWLLKICGYYRVALGLYLMYIGWSYIPI